MKITFDHNCIIHLESGSQIGARIRTILGNPVHRCFVVNVGASEMQRFGVRPENYGAFEELLSRCGIANLPRLNPIGMWGVTFWDHCLFAGESDTQLLQKIQKILFPPDASVDEHAPDERKDRNRLCDALTMWCHISYGNDVFLTTDENFFKATKQPQLVRLGAGSISHPDNL